MRRTIVGTFAFLSGLAMLVGCGDEVGGTTVVDKEYQAGNGLALDAGTTPPTFSVDFAGGGADVTASRSDHGHDADYVDLAGDTMTGALTLPGDPTGLLEAATKQYVDTRPAAAHLHALDDLSDVSEISVVDGDLLVYDDGSGEWVNLPAVAAGLATAAELNDGSTATTPVGWSDVDSKPATFPPDAHAHSSLVDSSAMPVERVFVDAAGKVGIGMNAPAAQVEIHNSNDAAVEPLEIYNDNGNLIHTMGVDSAGNGWLISRQDDGTPTFTLDGSTGNAGFGTVTADTLNVTTMNKTGTTTVTNLNADQVDSIHGDSLLRSDASDSYTSGTMLFEAGTTLQVEGALTVATTTRHLSIAGVAFRPYHQALMYSTPGEYINCVSVGAMARFHAPIQVPDGARLVNMKAVVDDNDGDLGSNVYVRVFRTHDTAKASVGFANTANMDGTSLNLDVPLGNVVVDNANNAYFAHVEWLVPATILQKTLRYVSIEYTVTALLP
jgi:hypothetical protein